MQRGQRRGVVGLERLRELGELVAAQRVLLRRLQLLRLRHGVANDILRHPAKLRDVHAEAAPPTCNPLARQEGNEVNVWLRTFAGRRHR